nr:hypothetical protein [uncultured Actinotalea sp.]
MRRVPGRRTSRRAAAVAAVVLSSATMTGCSSTLGLPGSSPASLGEESARTSIDDLLAPAVFHSYAHDVVTFAEHVYAAAEGSRILMLGVEEVSADRHVAGEPIGWIAMGLTVPDERAPQGYWGGPVEQDPGPHCFWVAFTNWGVEDVRGVDCPDELVAVPPPPSRRPRIAINAEEAVRAALTALPDDLPPDTEIVATVEALLEPHLNGVTPLAEVTASVQGGMVAVATGDDADCVLMTRSESGEVHDVYVPSVYFRPGELGCRASTAFADLRPPH